MSQDNLVKLQCTVCKKGVKYAHRNKKVFKDRFEEKKHCGNCVKHTTHKETK